MLREVLQDAKLRGKELCKQKVGKVLLEGILLVLLLVVLIFFLSSTANPSDGFIDLGILFLGIVLLFTDILNELFPYRLPKLFYFLPLDLKEKQKYLKTVFGLKIGMVLIILGAINGICYWKIQESAITIGIWFLLEMELALSMFLFNGISFSVFQEKRRSYFKKYTSKKAQEYTKTLPMLQIAMFMIFLWSDTFNQKHWFFPWVFLSILFLILSVYYVIRMGTILFPVLMQLGSDYEHAKEYINDVGYY